MVPAFNEADGISLFLDDLLKAVAKLKIKEYEIIIVNDGSQDNTQNVVRRLALKNDHLKLLNLSKNFGKEIATTAGIYYAKGEAIILIDADGQHPTNLIGEFIRQWKNGYQVVIGVRLSNEKEGFIKKYGSLLFYKLFNSTSDSIELIPGATDFRLIDRAVQKQFMQFTERYRITRGLIDWLGFKRTMVEFHAKERIAGKAGYSVSKLIKLALNSFVSLSMAPLYLIGYSGILITSVAFFLGVFVIIEQIILSDPLNLRFTGTAMIGLLILFLVGIVMIGQGLIALYLSHIHIQTQNRPLFIVDEQNSINIDDAL